MVAKQSEKILVTMEEIASYTGRNKRTILGWIDGQNFPATKVNGRWMAYTELIDSWHKHNIEKSMCKEA